MLAMEGGVEALRWVRHWYNVAGRDLPEKLGRLV
jgi:hypothetical protein